MVYNFNSFTRKDTPSGGQAALKSQSQNSEVYGPTMPKAQTPKAQVQSQPSAVSANPINMASTPAQTDAFGNISTRSWMTGAGLDNSKIGYDANRGMVTYNGKDFVKAASETDGTSYLNRSDAQQALVNYYKGEGKNLVEATPYLAQAGSPYKADYNNGTLTVGGIPVNTAFVDNGKAWVLESDLNNVLGQLNANSGYRNKNSILSEYQNKYEPMQETVLNKLINRKAFSYDPETDQVFQAYRQQYNREGNRSMEDAMGSVNALTGGLTNSAAVTAAGQARQYWSDKLMDRIPELEANAYNRYVGDYNMNRQALDAVNSVYDANFRRAYGVNSDIYNDLLAQRDWDYNRDQDSWSRNWQDRFNEQTYRGNEKNIWWTDANNTQNYENNEFNKYMTIADSTGKYPQWLIDRYQIDPNASAWAKADHQTELSTNANKELAKYQAELGSQYGGSSRSSGGSSGRSSSGNSSGSSGKTWDTFFNKLKGNDKAQAWANDILKPYYDGNWEYDANDLQKMILDHNARYKLSKADARKIVNALGISGDWIYDSDI